MTQHITDVIADALAGICSGRGCSSCRIRAAGIIEALGDAYYEITYVGPGDKP